jgi:hypothetical protein
MNLRKKRESYQFRRDEVAAEIVLCRVLGIPYCLDEAAIAHIRVGSESVGIVVVPTTQDSIEVDLEHVLDLAVDIIVFAGVEFHLQQVWLIGWLATNSICNVATGSSTRCISLTIDPLTLNSIESLAMKLRRHLQ